MFLNFFVTEDNFQTSEIISHGLKNCISSIHIPDDLSADEIKDLIESAEEDLLKKKDIDNSKFSQPSSSFNYSITNEKLTNAQVLELSHFYIYNNWVFIRSGVYDRYLKLNISHFVGRITDFYSDDDQDVFFIKWDTASLSRIPSHKVLQLIRRKISPFGTFVSADLILPAKQPNEILEVEQKQLEIYQSLLPKKFEIKFQSVFKDCINNLEYPAYCIWENYFHNFLIIENNISCMTMSKQEAVITSIAGSDEKNGVWVELISENESSIIPLNDIENILENPVFENIFHFYKHWSNIFCF